MSNNYDLNLIIDRGHINYNNPIEWYTILAEWIYYGQAPQPCCSPPMARRPQETHINHIHNIHNPAILRFSCENHLNVKLC